MPPWVQSKRVWTHIKHWEAKNLEENSALKDQINGAELPTQIKGNGQNNLQ